MQTVRIDLPSPKRLSQLNYSWPPQGQEGAIANSLYRQQPPRSNKAVTVEKLSPDGLDSPGEASNR